jgi:hypothetical protein
VFHFDKSLILKDCVKIHNSHTIEINLIPFSNFIFRLLKFQFKIQSRGLKSSVTHDFVKDHHDLEAKIGSHLNIISNLIRFGKYDVEVDSLCSIKLKLVHIDTINKCSLLIKSFFLSIKEIWQNKLFSAEKVLSFYFEDLPVGVKSASSYLRSRLRGKGFFKLNISFFVFFWESFYFILVAKKIKIDRNKSNYSIMPEPCYSISLISRYLESNHMLRIDIENPLLFSSVEIPMTEIPWRPSSNFSSFDKSFSQTDQLDRYMSARIDTTNSPLWYMGPKNEFSKRLSSLKLDYCMKLENNANNYVIFLHSIRDANFLFGYDGFNGISDWADKTIQTLSNNTDNRIYIKFHPNVNYNEDSIEFNFLKFLVNKFSDCGFVRFVDPTISLVELAKTGKFVGISHHGSVLEELVYMGVPVICFYKALYFDIFEIGFRWKNRPEFEYMVKDYDNFFDSVKIQDDKNKVSNLIYQYRLLSFPELSRRIPKRFIKDYSYTSSKEFLVDYIAFSRSQYNSF